MKKPVKMLDKDVDFALLLDALPRRDAPGRKWVDK